MSLSQEFKDEVRDRILFLLASEPLTTRELEARLGYSYTSIRRMIQDLLEEGAIMRFDKRARNSRYVINTAGNQTVTIVPNVNFKGNAIKLTNLYLDQGIEAVATAGADSLLRTWTTIAMTARRLNDGIPSNALMGKLNRQKVELANARMNLEHLIFMINQILDNHKLWEAEHLINFPNDPDWTAFTPHLEELYHKFYGGTENG